MERRLCVAGDVGHDALEDLGFVLARRAQLDVEVLQLEFLPPEIVAEPPKLALLVLFAAFVGELMAGDAFLHRRRVLFQAAAHCGRTAEDS